MLFNSKPLVIYHGGCRDGFCAAWVCYLALPEAEFFPAFYGQDPPDVTGRDVIMVDFSYPLETMRSITSSALTLLVLDHHKTAKSDLFSLQALDVKVVFDLEQSGAGLAWHHILFPVDKFVANCGRSYLVDYVEDRDLWRFRLQYSKEVNAFITTLPFDFAAWSEADKLSLKEVHHIGRIVQTKVDQYVRDASRNAIWKEFHGHTVPIVNAPPSDISELLESLCLGDRRPEFAVGWFQRFDGIFNYTLRSSGDFDVSNLAKEHGGGGHHHAAGFESRVLIHL